MTSGGWLVPDQEPGPAPGLAFGGFGARLVAYIVDIVIFSVIATILLIIGTVAAFASAGIGGVFLMFLLIGVASLAYFPYFWATSGSTPGMRMMGLRVVRDIDGGPISVGQAVLRLIGYWVSGAVLYLGYIWIFIDKRHRGWHDLIAGTVVVQRV
jgi:uncharacterized RDD family membrane protein YckC